MQMWSKNFRDSNFPVHTNIDDIGNPRFPDACRIGFSIIFNPPILPSENHNVLLRFSLCNNLYPYYIRHGSRFKPNNILAYCITKAYAYYFFRYCVLCYSFLREFSKKEGSTGLACLRCISETL